MNRVPYILVAGLAILVDRLLKGWAMRSLSLSETRPLIGQVIQLAQVHNQGGAFGIFPKSGALFIGVSAIVSVGIGGLLLSGHYRSRLMNSGLALVLAGAIGNLIDRLLYGYVLDFLVVRGLFVNNLADICVSVGVGLIVVHVLLGGDRNRTSR